MIRSKKILSVFLASPGDLPEERKYARNAADEWNAVNSDRTGWTIDLLGWEDTLPQTGRPQEIINAEIRRSLLFVGMMHRAWGSPTGNGYTSGFHEEFELARELHTKNQSPEIALFFKEIGPANDPGEQLKQVMAFREEVSSSKRFFYKELSSDFPKWSDEFRRVFHKLVFSYIDKIDRIASDADDDTKESGDVSGAIRERGGDEFRDKIVSLTAISERLMGAPTDYDVSAVDVARLRLIGAAWHRPGMTEAPLGTHDANIIFRQSDGLELLQAEQRGLIESGLAHLQSQNAPLWRWVSEGDADFHYLRALALYGSDETLRVGAINAMARAKIDLGGLREQFESAFDGAKPVVRNAMLNYVGALGGDDLLEVAMKEFQKADYLTLSSATAAILQGISRTSDVAALQFVLDQNVTLPSNANQAQILASVEGLSEGYLLLGLSHRDGGLRAASIQALSQQRLLTEEKRREMLDDPSGLVRAAAVSAALDGGEQLSLSDCEKIIVRKTKPAFGSFEVTQGTEEFDELRAKRLAMVPGKELLAEADGLYAPAETAYALLLSRNWKARAADARANVRDRFKAHYGRIRTHYLNTYGEAIADALFPPDSDLIFEYRASKMVRATMDVISAKGSRTDITLFRSALAGKYMTLSAGDLDFFARHGTLDDVELLARANRTNGGSLLSPTLSVTVDAVARAIIKIGKSDLSVILSKDIPAEVKKAVVKLAQKVSFSRASDDFLLSMVNEKDEEIRRVSAIRIAQCLPKRRIRSLDERYYAQGYHYYNVTHWFDLALSMPARIVEAATESELRETGS